MLSQSRQGARSAVATREIPDKLYFKIGEVATLVGVETHVLRYWEKEIPFIRPTKTPSNQRRYRRRDVEVFREIRRLLHDERYTLAGARRRLLGGDRGREEAEVVVPPTAAAPAPAPAPIEAQTAPTGRRTPRPRGLSHPQPPASVVSAPREEPGPPDRQLVLGFAGQAAGGAEKLARLRSGLEELVRMAGEEP